MTDPLNTHTMHAFSRVLITENLFGRPNPSPDRREAVIINTPRHLAVVYLPLPRICRWLIGRSIREEPR